MKQISFSALGSIVNSSSDAIFVKDNQGRYILVNSAAAEFINKSIKEIIGRTDAELLPPHIANQSRENDLKVISTGKAITYEDTEEINGETRVFHSTKSVYRDIQGQILGVFGISREITERRKAELERERLVTKLQSALDEIRILKEVLPICMYCKKIRDDEGAWTGLERYIQEHTSSQFSHGMCESCTKEKHPTIFAKLFQKEQ